MSKRIFIFIVFILSCNGIAYAIPSLQVYCPEDGVTYDSETESWIIPYTDYTLWVVGANTTIYDVKIAFAVPTDEDGTITINGTKQDGSSFSKTLDENSSYFVEYGTPLMGDGEEVPRGGVFPSSYYEYYLGNFVPNTTVYNYTPGSFNDTADGYIETLSISVQGYSTADIIAYDHVLGKNKAKSDPDYKYVFSPYSHDGSSNSVPEPATMLLFGTGLVGLAGFIRKRKK